MAILIIFVMAIFSEGLASISAIALSVPLLSAVVRRLHDAGYSGWWAVLAVVFWPALAVILMFDSNRTDNAYA